MNWKGFQPINIITATNLFLFPLLHVHSLQKRIWNLFGYHNLQAFVDHLVGTVDVFAYCLMQRWIAHRS